MGIGSITPNAKTRARLHKKKVVRSEKEFKRPGASGPADVIAASIRLTSGFWFRVGRSAILETTKIPSLGVLS